MVAKIPIGQPAMGLSDKHDPNKAYGKIGGRYVSHHRLVVHVKPKKTRNMIIDF